MASKHLRPPPPRPLYTSKEAEADKSDVISQSFDQINVDHQERLLDEEDRLLCLLLEAFPGISHETLAIAYARADKDPNVAAEILATESRNYSSELSTQTSELSEIWKPPNLGPERLLSEEEFCSFIESSRPKAVHFDDFRSEDADTCQLKNGHGDFSGASVWRDSPLLDSHSRPPEAEASSESSSVASDYSSKPNSPEDDGNGVVSFPALQRNKATRSSSSTPNWGTRSSPPPLKFSATSGSVSSRMQRRACESLASSSNGSEPTIIQRGVKPNDGLYSEKMAKRKNKVEDGKAVGEDSGSGEGTVGRRAAEDFLHSMLDADFGIDLVRDVLAHYEGDTGKTLETLLNIGSTSSGFDYSRNAMIVVDPFFSALGDQYPDNNEEVSQPASAFFQGLSNAEAGLATDHEAFVERLVREEDESHKILLGMLCEAFPTVEQSFLAQVLEAAEFSYDGALDIVRESGMIPVGEQNPKPKLDPAELLQALFKTKNEPPKVAGSCNAPLIKPTDEPQVRTTEEPWTVVVGKPRISRNPDMQAVVQKLRPNENGEWNEYAWHRASATKHWENMKMYLTAANEAHSRGDRARAGILSERGAKYKVLAQAASARASQNIFNVRNKDIANNITIDLHAQHVTEALRLLQLHLRALSQIPSVHGLTVITGQGSHSAGGQAKIKPAVTRYLDKKQVPWTQLNPGCIVIKMLDVRSIDANHTDAQNFSDSE